MNLKDILVPSMGESVTEATVLSIKKKVGDAFTDKDTILELETDKINVEVNVDSSGILREILVKEGDVIGQSTILARYEEGDVSQIKSTQEEKKDTPIQEEKKEVIQEKGHCQMTQQSDSKRASPAASHLIQNNESAKNLDIKASAQKGGVITKLDVENAISGNASKLSSNEVSQNIKKSESQNVSETCSSSNENRTEVVRMSGMRKTIARRLKEAQQTAAILTTFNEVDMSAAMDLRKKYQDVFQKKYGIKLGFMSIFARASALALQEIPAVNAEISGDNIIYKNFYNIGVAIGTEKGLVVPVLKDVNKLGLHEIEMEISQYAQKANKGGLTPNDFTGGTFTISNGGVYGSLMSTPIINPPQSAILGMHSIVQRPIAENGQVVIRPMMYLALSYDHRMIDGKEAVTFLRRIKEYIEDPERMLLFV